MGIAGTAPCEFTAHSFRPMCWLCRPLGLLASRSSHQVNAHKCMALSQQSCVHSTPLVCLLCLRINVKSSYHVKRFSGGIDTFELSGFCSPEAAPVQPSPRCLCVCCAVLLPGWYWAAAAKRSASAAVAPAQSPELVPRLCPQNSW